MFRYRGGSRGYATSTRAGRYTGVPMWRHITDSDAQMVFVAQIEDSGRFGTRLTRSPPSRASTRCSIGRGDLTAAFGDESKEPPAVLRAVERIAEAGRKANQGRSACMSVTRPRLRGSARSALPFSCFRRTRASCARRRRLACAMFATRSAQRAPDPNVLSSSLKADRQTIKMGEEMMGSRKALILATLLTLTPALPVSAQDVYVVGSSLGLTGYGSLTDGHWRDGLQLAIGRRQCQGRRARQEAETGLRRQQVYPAAGGGRVSQDDVGRQSLRLRQRLHFRR